LRTAAQRTDRGGLNLGLCCSQRGEQAIDAAHGWLAEDRRGDPRVPEVSTVQIAEQLGRAVDRVMSEGSCYDPDLAALAIKQAQGDSIEAAFLLRAYRSTLPRFAYALPLETAAMRVRRRVSAVFKDLPGGQVLGPTYDYTHRLLDFSLAGAGQDRRADAGASDGSQPSANEGSAANPPMPRDDQPIHRLQSRAAAIHPRLRAVLRS